MRNHIAFFALFALSILTLTSCEKEEQRGKARVEITDAPIDNANVSGAFVTVSSIKIDGQAVQGFNKTTIDLMAYQNGNTKVLGDFDLDAKSYSSITLVLDYATDASGNAPGCYVLEANNTKHALVSSATEITINKSYEIKNALTSALVIDFDLRKSIVESSGGSSNYSFVTASEMNSAVRMVTKVQTGNVQGSCSDNVSNSDKIVVYAYKQGTYVRNTETQGQGSSNIQFKNAVTSAAVDASGNFKLNFLEAGTYEIYFASYKDTNSDGKVELQGTLNVSVLAGLNLGAVSVGAEASITANVSVVSLLPL